jgi:hypothetical protein
MEHVLAKLVSYVTPHPMIAFPLLKVLGIKLGFSKDSFWKILLSIGTKTPIFSIKKFFCIHGCKVPT